MRATRLAAWAHPASGQAGVHWNGWRVHMARIRHCLDLPALSSPFPDEEPAMKIRHVLLAATAILALGACTPQETDQAAREADAAADRAAESAREAANDTATAAREAADAAAAATRDAADATVAASAEATSDAAAATARAAQATADKAAEVAEKAEAKAEEKRQ